MRQSKKSPVLGRVEDVFGDLWDVLQIRPTKHGFDLLFGRAANPEGYENNGPPCLIPTQALADFWHANRTGPFRARYDLPVGARTISRVRKLMGFNYSRDCTEFWNQRIDELATLTPGEFAERHGVGRFQTFEMRKRLVGRRQRETRWWRKPEILALFQSNLKPREIRQKLGDISIYEVYRIKGRVRREARQAAALLRQVEERPEAA